MSAFRDKIQAIQTDLSKLADAVDGVAPGPGITPAPATGKWWRSPGAPLTEPVPPAFDDIPTCKRYAAQGYGPDGARTINPTELESYLALCDKLGADTQTKAGAESLVKGFGEDTDAAIYACLIGYLNNFPPGLGGSPYIATVKGRVADLVKKAQGGGSPSGKPV